MFEIAEKRNSEYVYDLKGNTYVYWGEKTSEGYLCQEIYQVDGYSYDMPPYDELGKVVVLKEIYKEPPVQKQHEEIASLKKEIVELREKKQHFESEVHELIGQQIELEQQLKKTTEEILKEKFKDIPNAEFLINVAQKKVPIYNADRYGVYEVSGGIVGIDMSDGSVHCFYKGENGYYDAFNSKQGYTTFLSVEDAEKGLIEKALSNPENFKKYEDCLKLSDLMLKYGEIPQEWFEWTEERRKAHIKELEERISKEEVWIEKGKKQISEYIQEIEKCSLPNEN